MSHCVSIAGPLACVTACLDAFLLPLIGLGIVHTRSLADTWELNTPLPDVKKVRIRLGGTNNLGMREIEVYGCG